MKILKALMVLAIVLASSGEVKAQAQVIDVGQIKPGQCMLIAPDNVPPVTVIQRSCECPADKPCPPPTTAPAPGAGTVGPVGSATSPTPPPPAPCPSSTWGTVWPAVLGILGVIAGLAALCGAIWGLWWLCTAPRRRRRRNGLARHSTIVETEAQLGRRLTPDELRVVNARLDVLEEMGRLELDANADFTVNATGGRQDNPAPNTIAVVSSPVR